MTEVDKIIQSLEAKLARALKAKRCHKRRAEVYRAGLRHVVELPAVTKCELVRAALESIREGDKTK